jgi:hypothetical protein
MIVTLATSPGNWPSGSELKHPVIAGADESRGMLVASATLEQKVTTHKNVVGKISEKSIIIKGETEMLYR